MFITEGKKIVGFKALKYKGIVFDEWTEDEYGTSAEMCEHCLDKYKDRMDLEVDSSGGVGACSVRGCDVVGMDDNVEMTYIDFDINGVEIIEETLEELIVKLKGTGVDLDRITEELSFRDNAVEGMRWDDSLCEYTIEELEVIETSWNDFV